MPLHVAPYRSPLVWSTLWLLPRSPRCALHSWITVRMPCAKGCCGATHPLLQHVQLHLCLLCPGNSSLQLRLVPASGTRSNKHISIRERRNNTHMHRRTRPRQQLLPSPKLPRRVSCRNKDCTYHRSGAARLGSALGTQNLPSLGPSAHLFWLLAATRSASSRACSASSRRSSSSAITSCSSSISVLGAKPGARGERLAAAVGLPPGLAGAAADAADASAA